MRPWSLSISRRPGPGTVMMMAADDNTFGAAACTARLSATGRPNAATTQLATTCSAWRTVTCAKAGISVAASPRPSVDRLDMGWGALETLASQPLARAREEERGCNTTSNGGSGGRLCMRRWRVRRGGACACGGLRAFAPRAQVTRTLTPCLGPLSDCLLSSAGGVPGHVGLQAAIWPGADTHRK